MLTTGPQTQTPARTEQEKRQGDDGRVHQVHEDRLVEQDRADDQDLRKHGDLDVGQRELVGVQALRGVLHDRPVEERRQAQRQDVQDDADDDLVDPVLDGEERQQGPQGRAREGSSNEARVWGLEVRGRHHARKRADEQISLNRDINDADALRNDTREGTEDERRRNRHGGHEGRGQGDDARRPGARIEQESQDRRQPDDSHPANARPRGLGLAPHGCGNRPCGNRDSQDGEHPHDGRTRGDDVGDRIGLRLVVQAQRHVASGSRREDDEQHAGRHVDARQLPGALRLNLRDHGGLTCAHQRSPFASARPARAHQADGTASARAPALQSGGRSPTAE